MALALGQGGQAGQAPQVQAPQANGALQWAQILMPTLTQIYSITSGTKLGIAQSSNSARVAESTNNAFVGIAGKIQAPSANISTVNTTVGANSGTNSGNTANPLTNTSTVGANSGTNSGNTTTTTSTANPVTSPSKVLQRWSDWRG